MKIAITLVILFVCTGSYAQVKKTTLFTNEQSQLKKAEIIILRDMSQVVNSPDSSEGVFKKVQFSLNDFQEEAIYIVNGKPLTDPESVRYVLSDERKRIKDVFTSKRDKIGKRTIKIRYERF